VETFTITNAKEDDFDQLYAFVFDKPDPNVMKRSPGEVRKMVEDGLFFIVINDKTHRIVGCCYVRADSAELFEFGGAFVDKKYRDNGIFRLLGLSAIISHFLGQPDTPLIAHVVSGNPKPVNSLKSLMFKRTQEAQPYHKSIFLGGADHMEIDANGYILGDTYEFQRDRLLELAREAEDFPGYVDAKAGRSKVNIDLPTFDRETVRDLRKSLEQKK
jgi:hypothetical protein